MIRHQHQASRGRGLLLALLQYRRGDASPSASASVCHRCACRPRTAPFSDFHCRDRRHAPSSLTLPNFRQFSTNSHRSRTPPSSSAGESSAAKFSSETEEEATPRRGISDACSVTRFADEVNVRDRVRIIPLGRGVVRVLLSRPEKMNSLDMPMFEAIADAASRLANDADLSRGLRAVILSGEGRAFCTGLDAKSVALSGPRSSLDRLMERPSPYGGEDGLGNLAQDVCHLWRRLPVPVIACLHGMCFGGGLQVALGADMRFSTPDCRISIMESRWGLIPDMGASLTLRELVRADVAKELTMTGRILSGSEAESIGLVTRCVEHPVDEAMKVVNEILERSPDSVTATKELFHSTWIADEETCLKIETDLQMKLIGTWNQIAASGRNFGINLPYFRRRK